jgi:CHAT domain-containing protein
VKFRGPFGRNVLETVGRDVAALIPPLFFEILANVHAALGRTPTLLWLTDEAYVPWELATLAAPLDPGAPAFLAAQTRMGRWLDDEQVMLPPPHAVDVQRVSVVASKYGLAAGQRELTQAIAEREKLCKEWDGQPFEATADDLVTLATGAKLAGHLVHFAVHGFSDPMANAQSLLLADKSELPASALVGAHRCGEKPRFAFVFLNACQVGTPGRSLGQAGGFPGALLRGGANGVIAPLWDVDDTLAFETAEDFYESVFRKGNGVADALQERRCRYAGDATTPLAYIYYGHPALALRRVA